MNMGESYIINSDSLSSSRDMSNPGEENMSSSSSFEDDCDTIESIDDAIPPKLNIHETRKTNSLHMYKTNSRIMPTLDRNSNSVFLNIDAKELSCSPEAIFGDDSAVYFR